MWWVSSGKFHSFYCFNLSCSVFSHWNKNSNQLILSLKIKVSRRFKICTINLLYFSMFVISYFPLLLIEFSSFYPRKFSIKKNWQVKNWNWGSTRCTWNTSIMKCFNHLVSYSFLVRTLQSHFDAPNASK